MDTSAGDAWRDVLECSVGRARIAVPSELVDSIVELELAPPPPLARKWVGGLSYHEKKVVVCVSLVQQAAKGVVARRLVKGVFCRVKDSEVRWLLEVAGIRAFIRVKPLPARPTPANDQLPSWVAAALAPDQKSIGLIDVEAMVRELAGTA